MAAAATMMGAHDAPLPDDSRARAAARRALVLDLSRAGVPVTEIARRVGLSKGRVVQLRAEAGGFPPARSASGERRVAVAALLTRAQRAMLGELAAARGRSLSATLCELVEREHAMMKKGLEHG